MVIKMRNLTNQIVLLAVVTTLLLCVAEHKAKASFADSPGVRRGSQVLNSENQEDKLKACVESADSHLVVRRSKNQRVRAKSFHNLTFKRC